MSTGALQQAQKIKTVGMSQQAAQHLLLIEPAEFYANPQTMDTNIYQVEEEESHEEIFKKALAEFHNFRDVLVENDVVVTTVRGIEGCPDHIFPNWMSTHEGGQMILYPMRNENRRRERAPEMIDFMGRFYELAHDFRDFENQGQFLESLGSLCLDRVNKVAYIGLSARTDEKLARFWGEETGYDVEIFDTQNHEGVPVYHTDLLMFIGTDMAGLCTDCIVEGQRARVLSRLKETHDVVDLSIEQLQTFCGNALEIRNIRDEKMLVMSDTAYQALRDDQREAYLKDVTKILHAPIPTIEKYGGGSARCLIMELF